MLCNLLADEMELKVEFAIGYYSNYSCRFYEAIEAFESRIVTVLKAVEGRITMIECWKNTR